MKAEKTHKMKNKIIFYCSFLTVIIFATACRKDISLPDQNLKKLFGTWEWVQSSGGFSGQTITPVSEDYSMSVEYTEKGVYRKYKDGKKISKLNFKIEERATIAISDFKFLIDYREGPCSKVGVNSQSFRFGGTDTLFLNDDCYDCFSHIYVRKK